jgi:hypothetical protein
VNLNQSLLKTHQMNGGSQLGGQDRFLLFAKEGNNISETA